MSVGHKIRSIRDLRGMTQKEDKLKEITAALDVNASALKGHDIYSNLNLMQILFELEGNHGLDIEKEAD